MDYLFLTVCSLWFLSEVILNRLMRTSGSDRRNTDQNSLAIIWLTIAGSVAAAIFLSRNYAAPIAAQGGIVSAGLLIIVAGVLLCLWAVKSLGRFFTVDVTIRQEHQLKTDGCYTYIRHPSYAASLLSFTGFGIALNNWFSLLLILSAVFFAFSRRIHIEEKLLQQQFGETYQSYKRKTKKLIPFVY